MFRFMHGIFKWSVITALGLTGLVALVGVGRVKAAYLSVREHVRSNVDELVDAREVVKDQMRQLEQDYPKRIAELDAQRREIDRALAANAKEHQLAEEVVALCRSDHKVLTAKLDAADADADGINTTVIEFRSQRLDRGDALARADKIAETQANYVKRLSDLDDENALLSHERGQIAAEYARTSEEFRNFQMEYATMLREADSLKRKQELVKMAEKRRGERDDIFTDRSSSLQSLKDRMEKRRVELDARLKALGTWRDGNEYETRARLNLDRGHAR
jgi:chromosome segregation ATPase